MTTKELLKKQVNEVSELSKAYIKTLYDFNTQNQSEGDTIEEINDFLYNRYVDDYYQSLNDFEKNELEKEPLLKEKALADLKEKWNNKVICQKINELNNELTAIKTTIDKIEINHKPKGINGYIHLDKNLLIEKNTPSFNDKSKGVIMLEFIQSLQALQHVGISPWSLLETSPMNARPVVRRNDFRVFIDEVLNLDTNDEGYYIPFINNHLSKLK